MPKRAFLKTPVKFNYILSRNNKDMIGLKKFRNILSNIHTGCSGRNLPTDVLIDYCNSCRFMANSLKFEIIIDLAKPDWLLQPGNLKLVLILISKNKVHLEKKILMTSLKKKKKNGKVMKITTQKTEETKKKKLVLNQTFSGKYRQDVSRLAGHPVY